MGKRKDIPQKADSKDDTNATEKAAAPEIASERPADPLLSVESPELVPHQIEAAADDGPPIEAFEPLSLAPPVELPRIVPVSPDVVTVSFEQAASTAAPDEGGEPDRQGTAAIAAYLRAKRFLPLAATIAVAVALGAIAGTFATGGMSRLFDPAAQSASLDDSRALKETIARIGSDVAALKANIDNSAKSAGVQFTRLGERLDRADRAQAEASGKVAKLAETLERRSAAASAAADPVTTGSIAPTSPAPQLHAPATRPAGQPIVEGWALRNVYNGTAVIQGRIGLVEVEPGDTIPGLGRIETIRRQDGQWVVVTNRGLVIPR